LVLGVDFPGPVGAVSCGAGNMLLALTTRRVRADSIQWYPSSDLL